MKIRLPIAIVVASHMIACASKPPIVAMVPHLDMPRTALLPAPLSRVRNCAELGQVDKSYNDLHASTVVISDKHSAASTPFASFFARQANASDVIIWHIDEPVTRSLVYCAGGQSLEYGATFRIHLEPRSGESTFVEITASAAHVEVPVEANWSRYNRERRDVIPTGFEEYAILRTLGVCAGMAFPEPTFPSQADRNAVCGKGAM